ncbi:YdiU family protein [Thioalkalivibrio sp. ALJ24]|uniref:protein adenylyltransferase SelO n=1 Tax=Thioalkalivibrio sp. ALJ24 TaxID=545276 RepID=UPI000360714F|nr:YdiU family protein [Thioalkalivibrio sp. ALJ24]
MSAAAPAPEDRPEAPGEPPTGGGLEWINRFAALPDAFHHRPDPAPFPGAQLLASSPAMRERLSLTPDDLAAEPWLGMITRGEPVAGTPQVASVYAGHQFGVYVPQLGDGRAKLLGEVRTPAGEHWELQSKGSGPTAFSRHADGRAVLRSSIREYLVSEHMAAMGIPTTRAVALYGSSLRVFRERIESGAVVLRAAPSFLRFGHFEYFHYAGYPERLRQLIDYALDHDFPEHREAEDPVRAMLETVTARTAELMADWQAVGFCHGVMNTDNMSLTGLTIDYGPFAFMDAYDPDYICNHTDQGGRYAFARQPGVALWNLTRLAETLVAHFNAPDVDTAVEQAKSVLEAFQGQFRAAWLRRMRAKLGLQLEREEDESLVQELLARMAAEGIDYTRLFRQLPELEDGGTRQGFIEELEDPQAWQAWEERYRERLAQESRPTPERHAAMRAVNPKYVLRNHLAQTAIERAEDGDFSELERLQRVLSRPFDEQPEAEDLAELPPAWASGIQLSCSS